MIGDVDTGSYVTPGIAEFFRDRALKLADIATPNLFELEYLTGARDRDPSRGGRSRRNAAGARPRHRAADQPRRWSRAA